MVRINLILAYSHMNEGKMKNLIQGIALTVLAIGLPFPVYAESFTGLCKDDVGKGFRNETDLSGMPSVRDWTEDENFGGTWRFHYDNSKTELMIDGKPTVMIVRDGKQMIALQFSQNETAVSLWSYAINLNLEEVVASQVNSFNMGPWNGLKSRAISFTCNFTYG